jgi:aspartyl-tRNA(Asn)/glutamyl-tRNA(Gln) amidotransferase subunit B
VNSFRSIERAVRYEIQRQAVILATGGSITQETRHWHEDTGTTSPGRPKSDADDYRYFPEPDLLPVEASRELVESLRQALPEQPVLMRRRLRAQWGFSDIDFGAIVNAGLITEIHDTILLGVDAVAARKWWMGELSRLANDQGVEPGSIATPEDVHSLQSLVDAGRLTDKLAREVLGAMVAGEGSPEDIVIARGLEVVSDDGALLAAIDEALAAQPDVLGKIREGKTQAAGAVIGAVMKAMRGQADAARVHALVIDRANKSG